jgi:hypothetical protein
MNRFVSIYQTIVKKTKAPVPCEVFLKFLVEKTKEAPGRWAADLWTQLLQVSPMRPKPEKPLFADAFAVIDGCLSMDAKRNLVATIAQTERNADRDNRIKFLSERWPWANEQLKERPTSKY